MTSVLDALLYDPRDLGIVALVFLATLPSAAWVGFWFRTNRTALEKTIDRHDVHLRRIDRLLLIDDLTGLRNQRALESHALPNAVRNVREQHTPLTAAVVDFDNFKNFNTVMGQRRADEVVRQAADRMRRSLAGNRASDEIFRRNKGGDEFVILLPGADTKKAGEILRNVLAGLHEAGVSASIGAVVAHAGNLPAPQALLDQAEQQMQRAKITGKGRIIIAAAVTAAEHDRPTLAIGGAA